MVEVTTLLDQVRDAIRTIEHALEKVAGREIAMDDVAVLNGISDDCDH